MKKLNRNEGIAVLTGLGLLAYLLFSGPIMSLFSSSNDGEAAVNMAAQSEPVIIEDVVVGTGELVESGDILSVHYVGTLTDGRVFDSSVDRGTPFSFVLGLGQVIRGWDEGLQGMRVGGKRRLTISPEYAYGPQGAGPIPPNSTLIFEVELLGIEKSQ